MGAQKHTPGPWRSHGAGGEIHGNSRVVATMCWCSGMHDEDEANARLVEAAPDLLAALRSLLRDRPYGQSSRKWLAAHAAVSKAIGK